MKLKWLDITKAVDQIAKVPANISARINGDNWMVYRVPGKQPIIRVDIKEIGGIEKTALQPSARRFDRR